MTSNQIAYQNMLENQRHNLTAEFETNRSNVAKEKETHRSNLENERVNRTNAVTKGFESITKGFKHIGDFGKSLFGITKFDPWGGR